MSFCNKVIMDIVLQFMHIMYIRLIRAHSTLNSGALVVTQSSLHLFHSMSVGIVLPAALQTNCVWLLHNAKLDRASKAMQWTCIDSSSAALFRSNLSPSPPLATLFFLSHLLSCSFSPIRPTSSQ